MSPIRNEEVGVGEGQLLPGLIPITEFENRYRRDPASGNEGVELPDAEIIIQNHNPQRPRGPRQRRSLGCGFAFRFDPLYQRGLV